MRCFGDLEESETLCCRARGGIAVTAASIFSTNTVRFAGFGRTATRSVINITVPNPFARCTNIAFSAHAADARESRCRSQQSSFCGARCRASARNSTVRSSVQALTGLTGGGESAKAPADVDL